MHAPLRGLPAATALLGALTAGASLAAVPEPAPARALVRRPRQIPASTGRRDASFGGRAAATLRTPLP
jgi:hypothetical protein